MNDRVIVQDGEMVRASGPAVSVPWWSFTKTVLAAAALVLVQDKRLSLDGTLPGRGYTLRQLLQHRAGLANYGGFAAYHDAVARGDDPWPVAELLSRCEADRPIYRAGEGWAYSNIGYLFVRNMIEVAANAALDVALARLVLHPLGIDGVRVASRRSDLAEVSMGVARGYDPGWVYHGLLVGPLAQAALLLDRLMAGRLLPPTLLSQMLHRHPVGGSVPDRPWLAPGYGLGLMTGTVMQGSSMAGHTGGGPGSVVAVYHHLPPLRARTIAAFSFGEAQGMVERCCIEETSP